MSLLSLQTVGFDFGRETILRDASLALHPGEHCSLVGANGTGKSTLLAIMSGELQPQNGTVQKTGGAKVVHLRQETVASAMLPGDTLFEAVAAEAFAEELRLESELARVATAIAAAAPDEMDALARKQGDLQTAYERREGYAWRAKLQSTLAGLGVREALWELSPEVLSGGERRRAALAAALLSGGCSTSPPTTSTWTRVNGWRRGCPNCPRLWSWCLTIGTSWTGSPRARCTCRAVG